MIYNDDIPVSRNQRTMKVLLILFILISSISSCLSAEMFNFRLLTSKNSPAFAHTLCQNQGYDGLAVLSSPEAYRQALDVTAPNRTDPNARIAIGLFFDSKVRDVRWADGTVYAADTPWNNPPPDKSGALPYGRMRGDGKFIMTRNSFKALSLCGTYFSKETLGRTLSYHSPNHQTGNLAVKQTSSFLKCTALCSTDSRCRAAEFNHDSSTCKTFDAEMFSGFSANAATSTFSIEGF